MNDESQDQSSKADDAVKSLKSIYKICIETRNFEINQLINRNNFFMLFQGVLLASVMQEQLQRPFVEVLICVTGLCVSYYQLQMASGAKFWQEWWEARVMHFEEILCRKLGEQGQEPYKLFCAPPGEIHKSVRDGLSDKGFTNHFILKKYSVSRAPINVAIVLVVVWLFLLGATFNWSAFSNISFISGFYRSK